MTTDLGQLLAAAVEDRTALPVLADFLEDLGLGHFALLLRREQLPADFLHGLRDLTYCLPTADVALTCTRAWCSEPKRKPCAILGLFLGAGQVSLSCPVECTEPETNQVASEFSRFRM